MAAPLCKSRLQIEMRSSGESGQQIVVPGWRQTGCDVACDHACAELFSSTWRLTLWMEEREGFQLPEYCTFKRKAHGLKGDLRWGCEALGSPNLRVQIKQLLGCYMASPSPRVVCT